MKLKQTLSFITALTLTVGVAWADTVKIGFNVPLTGFAAADGESRPDQSKTGREASQRRRAA